MKSAFDSFNSLKSTYDTAKTSYETQVDLRATQELDFFKNTFEPKVSVPARPCPPTQPMAYWGPNLLIAGQFAATTTWANLDKTNKSAILIQDGQTTPQTLALTTNNRVGYLQAVSNNKAGTPTTADLEYTGHVLGRLGQAKVATSVTAFKWLAKANTQVAGMMVSMLPTATGNTGLAATKEIVIEANAVAFSDYSEFNQPSRPGAASDPKCFADKSCPDQKMGAKALAVASAAVLAVSATLF